VDASGEVVITSSSADELSQESDEVGGSYFTHYLLSGLRGAADTSGDGEVTLDEAYRYVYYLLDHDGDEFDEERGDADECTFLQREEVREL
jgi:uncharacterized caspase-like protein